MNRISFLDFQKGLMVAMILTGHYVQFYVYSGSELYWVDPVLKTLYIFAFAYYFAVNGYAISSDLATIKVSEVFKYKFVQYLLPFCFWYGVGLIFLVGLHVYQTGELARPQLQLALGFVNAFWILFSDVFSTLLIRLLLLLPVPARLTIPLSILLIFLIPNGDGLTLVSMVRYAYLAFAGGYLIGLYRINATPRWWMVSVMIPLCGVIYQLWTIDTYIYLNRLNYLSHDKRGEVALMIAGTALFSITAYPFVKWLYFKFRDFSGFNNYIFMLASLNSLIVLFEVDFYLVIDRTGLAKTHIYLLDLAIAFVGSFAVMALIPKTFRLIRPGSLLFRFIWGTTASLGDDLSKEGQHVWKAGEVSHQVRK